MNAHAPLAADPTVVRTFVERLHAHAASATAAMPNPGFLQLVRIFPDGVAITEQYAVGEVDHMVDEAIRQSKTGHNLYVEGRTVRKRARGEKGRGTIADTVAVFGLVVDDDADKGKGSRVTATPSLIVESSPGNSHRWFLLSQAIPADRAVRIGLGIKAKAGGDADSGVITQPYRVAGTVNFPSRSKVARGRVATHTGIISLDGPIWLPDDLEAAFPRPEKAKRTGGPRPEAPSGRTSATAEAIAAQTGGGDRSALFFEAVLAAFADGLLPDDLEGILRRHPEGCAGKYLDPYDRLRREIDRAWEKIEARAQETGRAAAEPTYPDLRIPLDEAEERTRAVVTAFFTEHVPAWRDERDAWKDAHAAWKAADGEAKDEGRDAPAEPVKPAAIAWAARIETGIGKTALAIAGAAAAARVGIATVYAAPTHGLLGELAERFAAEGIEARVYRGYGAEDPDAPGLAMCLDPEAAQDARDAGAAVPTAVCKRKVDGQDFRCALIDRCGMERQRSAKAKVWLVPHSLLGHMRPEFIPEPDAVVIDEGIVMGALPDKPARMTLDAIERADVEMSDTFIAFTNFANDLSTARGSLLRALRDHRDDGPLQRSLLARHGVTRAVAASAYKMEWDRRREANILPGMLPKVRKACVAAVGQHNAEIRLLAGIWDELRTFLDGDAAESGRLALRYDPDAEARVLERRSLDSVVSSWSAPVLAIDATLPQASILEAAIGQRVEIRADIAAHWSAHVTTRQIVGSPTTASKLGIVEGKQPEEPRRVVHHLLRLIRLRAALAWPRAVVVIAPKRLIEILTGIGLPPNVEAGHFGAIAGIDRWRDAAGLICIGRLQPGPPVAEGMAGVVTGRVPQTIAPAAHGGTWYPKVEAGIRLADGTGIRVETERHPDPMAEALRAQVTEGQLIQSIGRLRPLRRTADAPAFLDIIGDVPLPISVDRVLSWDEALPGAWAEMATAGVVLTSPADIMRAFPQLAPTRKAAREHTVPTMAPTSIREYLIGLGATPGTVFWYKRRGADASVAYLLPNGPADLRDWLSARLKGFEWLEVEGQARQGPPVRTPERDGIALESPADMAAAWPDVWPTLTAARHWRERHGDIVLPGDATRFRYQRSGRNQKWRAGAHDPAAVPDPRGWLERRLGPLAGFVLDLAESAPPAPAPGVPPMRCADYDSDLAALYRTAADVPPRAARPASVIPEIIRWRPPRPDLWPTVFHPARQMEDLTHAR